MVAGQAVHLHFGTTNSIGKIAVIFRAFALLKVHRFTMDSLNFDWIISFINNKKRNIPNPVADNWTRFK
jgi:hypothetical protein